MPLLAVTLRKRSNDCGAPCSARVRRPITDTAYGSSTGDSEKAVPVTTSSST